MQNAKILRTMELHLHSNHKSWYPQQLDKLCGCKVGIKENVVRFEYLAELTFPFSSPRVQKFHAPWYRFLSERQYCKGASKTLTENKRNHLRT